MLKNAPEFSVDDVKRVAEFIIENTVTIDSSGSRNTHGRVLCSDCGKYDFEDGRGIEHKYDCITKVAQDLLTGLEPNYVRD